MIVLMCVLFFFCCTIFISVFSFLFSFIYFLCFSFSVLIYWFIYFVYLFSYFWWNGEIKTYSFFNYCLLLQNRTFNSRNLRCSTFGLILQSLLHRSGKTYKSCRCRRLCQQQERQECFVPFFFLVLFSFLLSFCFGNNYSGSRIQQLLSLLLGM